MFASTPHDKLTDHSTASHWLDRDLSLLAFNARVLDWAKRPEVPLLERLRYLCIVSSNLDEFFEVRAALHHSVANPKAAPDAAGAYAMHSLSKLAHELVDEQYALYNDVLMPAFAKEGVRILSQGERTLAQHRWVKTFFEREVRPLLLPVGLDPAHPFPQVANKSLNFIVRLSGSDAFGRDNEIAIVKVPRSLPRLIRLPDKLSGKRMLFVSISSVIRAHLKDLFPGRDVGQFSQFRVTRHSDLAVDEEDVKNLRTALRQGLVHRNYGQAVRLEVSAGCSEYLSDFLLHQFELPPSALYRVHGPVNLVRLNQLIDLVDNPALLFPAYHASYPHQLSTTTSIFDQLQAGDVLIHQPYESFDGVLAFLREAVRDPDVLAIKQTIYRTGADSALMELLREAVQRGKEVTVVVELKARFDEEANINWAEKLEYIGAQVVYGVVGLKTHAKMLLVSRREGRSIRRYAHLSTGNYNPRTAKLYTDLSHLTCDPKLTQDIENVFNLLANQSKIPRLNKLWLAPFYLQRNLIDMVDKTAQAAAGGLPCRIVLKMNTLTDEKLMESLLRAGLAGVDIDLIVRGACMLPAQRPGVSENIRVRSIIGRFLEHSRVFYFRSGEVESLYLSSADWMNRNMLRRVELAWPVEDPALRQRIVDECLVAYLQDNVDAWTLNADGHYTRVVAPKSRAAKPKPLHGAQAALMDLYSAKP
ncbi:polyphosphate kinase 1 [Limnohabitans sp. JirII-31]|uniref:polyphosphate kinase 1 n=1 Tax=Limnohabitans sp. JirII-31 TaxID=1977908 RepID=UPI000C1EDC50|nr:polyphosphate kinase 1 [Limnohabitans sp. JirII-31]PIT74252.1 polyphosphate kinase 1 [Limnohabitans sp. JirII-31]